MSEPDRITFLVDVSKHEMTVALDNGLYRHLVFRQPQNGWHLWFGIVTWPGYLTICGDMGTWTFARLPDMFTFFRSAELKINADYWSEKLQHGTFGGREGAQVWDDNLFKSGLLSQLTDYYGLEGEELNRVTAALREEVLSQDNKYDLLIAARDFEHEGFMFDPCELPSGKEYSYHFVWCLYAIVWAIQQYDARERPA